VPEQVDIKKPGFARGAKVQESKVFHPIIYLPPDSFTICSLKRKPAGLRTAGFTNSNDLQNLSGTGAINWRAASFAAKNISQPAKVIIYHALTLVQKVFLLLIGHF
jgi:hypothetical protein